MLWITILSTSYLLASWGRNIEIALKEGKKYDATEITDIKFYVLYAVTSLLVNNIYPGSHEVAKLDIQLATTKLINEAIVLVFDLYKDLGGNERIAKGPSLTEALKEKLRTMIES